MCCRPWKLSAGVQDAKSEHAGRLLKLEQERSSTISALEEENTQLRLELSNMLSDADVRHGLRRCCALSLQVINTCICLGFFPTL
jgi:hypothetical protein